MTNVEDRHRPPTLGERYARATVTSDLTVSADDRTDADKLLAAGFASAGNMRGQMALALYRLDFNHVCTIGELVLLWHSGAANMMTWTRRGGRLPLYQSACLDISEEVIRWWIDGICPACSGRRFELIPGTQLTSATACQACDGIGKPPVETRLRQKHQEAGRWLADDFRAMLGYVFSAMAAKLSLEFSAIDLGQAPALQSRLTDLRSQKAQED